MHSMFAMLLVALAILSAGCREQTTLKPQVSNVKADEEILFFPTYGQIDPDADVWRFDVHGIAFEPEMSSTKRAALIEMLQLSADPEDAAFLDERIRPFVVDNERGKTVVIRTGGEQFVAGTSKSNGHFDSSLTAKTNSSALSEGRNPILRFEAVLRDGDKRAFKGRVHLIARQGISVISDIDDTIKHSQVTDKSELLQNTFLREFRAIDGMPELYSDLNASGVSFHYVSGSPWQLYESLQAFMSDVGFPEGTFHLKHFRLKDSSALDLLSSQEQTKLAAITPLLEAFPQRRFILIGDSGEQDPEIYGQLARKYSDQIVGIFIRNATGEKKLDQRFANAFRDLPDDHWLLFDEVAEITERINTLASQTP